MYACTLAERALLIKSFSLRSAEFLGKLCKSLKRIYFLFNPTITITITITNP